jgi:hypothetical protein
MVDAFKILKIFYQNIHIKDGFQLFLIIYLESAYKADLQIPTDTGTDPAL